MQVFSLCPILHKSPCFYIYFAISSMIWKRRRAIDERAVEKIIFSVVLRIARADRGVVFSLSVRGGSAVCSSVCGGVASVPSRAEDIFGFAYPVSVRGGRIGGACGLCGFGRRRLSALEDRDGDRRFCGGGAQERQGTA